METGTITPPTFGVVKSDKVSIRPFVRPDISNMGLERQDPPMSLFAGIGHHMQLACVEQHGVQRYLTGLNEFAPEVTRIKDSAEKAAKIKQIRLTVKDLEEKLAANVLDIEDKDFWNKVIKVRPDNFKFWNTIDIVCGNGAIFLDPEKDPFDLIKILAIEAGGFSIIAKSFEEAKQSHPPVKFYLDRASETNSIKVEIKKLRNKALAELQNMFDKNAKKLFYVTKLIEMNSSQYKKNTPNDVLYEVCDSYINNGTGEKGKVLAIKTFLSTCEKDLKTLKVETLIKDSNFYKVLSTKSDGYIYHVSSKTNLGKNIEECIEFLQSPLNESILIDLTSKVEAEWNR